MVGMSPGLPAPAAPGRIYLVDRQDAPQSVIVQALRAPPRSAPDFYALAAADAVYGGGGFGTRLNLNLREGKGYSYGVFSALSPVRDANLWAAAGGVQGDRTAESLVEFRKELADLASARPISAEELELARQRKLRGYAQGFEAYGRIADQVARLWVLGQPFAELQREADATARLGLEEVRAAAAAHAAIGGTPGSMANSPGEATPMALMFLVPSCERPVA